MKDSILYKLKVSESEDEDGYVLIDSLSDSEVEPIVEFPESDVERLAATQSELDCCFETVLYHNWIVQSFYLV